MNSTISAGSQPDPAATVTAIAAVATAVAARIWRAEHAAQYRRAGGRGQPPHLP